MQPKILLRYCFHRFRILLGILFLVILFFFVWSFTLDQYDEQYKKWMLEHPNLVTVGPLDEESTWECTGQDAATRICVYKNLCIDRQYGAYVRVRDPSTLNEFPPDVNMISTGETEHIVWAPKVRPIMSFWKPTQGVDVDLINETLFVYGLYSPFHFSHQLYNGLLPLYSVMKDYKATRSSWTFRPVTFWFKPHSINLDFITSGKDIVFNENQLSSAQQILPPKRRPVCFARAVVGSGTRCSHDYCKKLIHHDHYNQFRNDVMNYYIDNNSWNNTTAKSTEEDLHCIKNITVYPPIKQVHSTPPTIGLLNRKHSRHVTNMAELLQALRKEIPDARIKLFDFDSGCSLAATAYVMRDIDLFISPFGNAIGCNIFQRPNRVTVSLAARWYSENWFLWPSTGMGRRIYNFECDRSECQEKDYELARSLFQEYNAPPTDENIEEFVNTDHYPNELNRKLFPDNEWLPYGLYSKQAKRKVDIEFIVPWIRGIIDDMVSTGTNWSSYTDNLDYPMMCKQGKCCGPKCLNVMGKTVFSGNSSAWDGVTGEGVEWQHQQ